MDQFDHQRAEETPIRQGRQTATRRGENRRQEDTAGVNLARRRFLRGAAIAGGAATLAAASAAAVVVAEGGSPTTAVHTLITQFNAKSAPGASGATGTMSFEDTGFTPESGFTVHANGKTSPGDFFIWLTGHNLPAGNYTFSITPTLGDGTTPFMVTSKGNNAFVYQLPAGTASDSPSSTPSGQVQVAHDPAALTPVTINSTSDLQLQVHIQWNGGAITSSETITFNGTITDGTTTVSASISVTAQPG